MFSDSVSVSILFRRWNNNISPHLDIVDNTININYFFVVDVNVGFEMQDLRVKSITSWTIVGFAGININHW